MGATVRVQQDVGVRTVGEGMQLAGRREGNRRVVWDGEIRKTRREDRGLRDG